MEAVGSGRSHVTDTTGLTAGFAVCEFTLLKFAAWVAKLQSLPGGRGGGGGVPLRFRSAGRGGKPPRQVASVNIKGEMVGLFSPGC